MTDTVIFLLVVIFILTVTASFATLYSVGWDECKKDSIWDAIKGKK